MNLRTGLYGLYLARESVFERIIWESRIMTDVMPDEDSHGQPTVSEATGICITKREDIRYLMAMLLQSTVG